MTHTSMAEYIPKVRPHIQRRDRALFFMISRRPLLDLTAEEVVLFDSIDGRKTVAELEDTQAGAGARLLKWHEASILELLLPIAPPAHPHLVVVEPHMDDAALSAGGRLLHRRGRYRITILTVVKWSNFTSYILSANNPLSVAEVTDLRQRESDLVARFLGAEHRALDWSDAPIRFVPPERWSPAMAEIFKTDPGGFVNLFPNPRDVAALASQLKHALVELSPDELWIPMGLGEHVDHRTTRSACLHMLAESPEMFAKFSVEMYEDIPYAKPPQVAQIESALAAAGTHQERGVEDVTDTFKEKLRAASIYASQFKISQFEKRLREAAQREGGSPGELGEAYHRIQGPLRPPPESHLSRHFANLSALQIDLLAAKTTSYRRLTLIALRSGHLGRWKANSDTLAEAFPNTDLRVYAAKNVAWEMEEGGNKKLQLRFVCEGWAGLADAVRCELFHFRTPTVLLWSGAYGTGFKRRLIRSILPFRRVLFVKALSDFCGILNEQLESRPR